jgi:hypothetical protein
VPSQPTGTDVPRAEASRQILCDRAICTEFATASEAILTLVTPGLRAIGFGEAHAREGFVGRSTVRRFSEELLPDLAPHSHFLLVELLAPPSNCEEAKREVQRESDAITEGQARENQNEYVSLGHQARQLGLLPDILRPNCQQMEAISKADPPVVKMMEAIATLTVSRVAAAAEEAAPERPLLLLYGGALHNDTRPRDGLEAYSYGKSLSRILDGGYIEVDLVVVGLMQDTESWRKFPWYGPARSLPEGHGPVLIDLGDSSFALVFAEETSEKSARGEGASGH